MRIAVTYDNGEVFQHFGHTENFIIYEVEDNKVLSGQVVSSNGQGHEALAQILADGDVDVLICGGIGGGAVAALGEAGIQVFPGATGSTDDAVNAYLRGELVTGGANCDHHHDEEEEHSCGGSCGGCHGCGGRSDIEGPNVGKTLRVHYCGTFNDGSQFDSSYDRGEPLEFMCGAGMMIHGFDKAVADMTVGEIRDIHLMPEEAYGMPDPSAIFTVEVDKLPGSEELAAGDECYLTNPMGQPFPVRVVARDGGLITFDANHEMAGKELNFKIELVEIL